MLLVSGTTRTVAGLASRYPNHLGKLVTPQNWGSIDAVVASGLRWAVDNGAFRGFDSTAFRRLLRRVSGQPLLLWVACPDAVGDAVRTIGLFREWEPELRAVGVPVAFVLQDGQERHELPHADCYFVGGSTEFKLSEAAGDLVAEGKRRGAWIHVGRVNSRRRLETCLSMGADSVDGSSLSMFGDTHILKFIRWVRQLESRGEPLFE